MNQLNPCDHTTIQEGHTLGVPTEINGLLYPEQEIEMTVTLTKAYFRKQALRFQHCPECEGSDLEYYGHSPKGTQKYHCRFCGHQFVSQRDSVFPRTTRRDMFLSEFQARKTTYDYWEPALLETLIYLESHQGRLMINKMLRNTFDGEISCQREFEVLTLIAVRESYNYVMASR